MFCEHCGAKIADAARACPLCGNDVDGRQRYKRVWQQGVTSYGPYSGSNVGEPVSYQQGYMAQPEAPLYGNPELAQQNPYQHYVPPMLYAGSTPAPAFNVVKVSTKNNSALVVEIILSLFGLFGVGWLMAGEVTIGAILLICSIFLYWPFIILGTIFTLGLGLICIGPLAIVAIIVNILLLNTALERYATRYIVTPQQMYTKMPPQH